MKRVTRRAAIAGSASLAAAAFAAPARAAFGDSPFTATATLGVVAPFSGPDIRLGEQLANGVRAAIDDANRLRGALDRAFAFRTFNDENLLATGIVNAQFAVDDPSIVGVIGHLSGHLTDAALRVYATGRMPLVVPATTFDDITSHGYRAVLRLPTKDSFEGQLAARYFGANLPYKNAVALVQDGDYGYNVASAFVQQSSADKRAAQMLVFGWEKPDFAGVARRVLELKPDFIYLAGLVHDMGPIVPALRAAGYTGPFAASQGFFDPLTLDKFAASVEGIVVSTSMPPLALAPTVFRVRGDFEARYGALTPLSAFGYAAAQIFISAIRRTGASDRTTVARALVNNATFDTVVGSFTFSPTGDSVDPNLYFYTVRDRKWAYLRASHPTSFILK